MLYDDWFAQVLEGPQAAVETLFDRIKQAKRHDTIRLDAAGIVPRWLFGKSAMAVVAEHHQPDMPMVATTGGLAQGAPWKVTPEQEAIPTRLRDLTRGYGRGSWRMSDRFPAPCGARQAYITEPCAGLAL